MKRLNEKVIDVECIGGPEDGLRLPILVKQFLEMQRANAGRMGFVMRNHLYLASERWNGVAALVRLFHAGRA